MHQYLLEFLDRYNNEWYEVDYTYAPSRKRAVADFRGRQNSDKYTLARGQWRVRLAAALSKSA